MIPMRDDAALGRTDGWANLVNAVRVAAAGRIREVAIVFGSRILRGNRATKAGTFDLDGFASPNHSGLGYIGKDIAYVPDYRPPKFKTERVMIPDRWPTVGWVKSFPGLVPETLRPYLRQLEGCVLETFGSGSLPLEVINEFHTAEIPSVMCLPGNQGPKDAYYFDPGLRVEDRLVVSGRDMTREAAVTKLMWAVGVNREKEGAAQLLRESIAGEMEEEVRPYYGIA
jgi:L-asparaginase